MGCAAAAWVIWRFSDGKAGHDSQSLGLAEALGTLVPVEVHHLSAWSLASAVLCLLRGVGPVDDLPRPRLLIGAGHGTHLSLLAARRAYGGRVVVLMRPSLPWYCFDLCVVPRHDRPPQRSNVLVSRGVLNRIRPALVKDPSRAMVLIGGPSEHFHWDPEQLVAQLRAVIGAGAGMHWTLATSRRTPAAFQNVLHGLEQAGVEVVSARETDPGWLPRELGQAATVWVTQDSVSMVYEALSSGAAVGILELPARGRGRVSHGVETLLAEGCVVGFSRWSSGAALCPPAQPFSEAERVARQVSQWAD